VFANAILVAILCSQKTWDVVVKEDMKKRSLCIKTETSGVDAAEEWSTPVNWKEDPTIKAERREVSPQTLIEVDKLVSKLQKGRFPIPILREVEGLSTRKKLFENNYCNF